MSQAALPYQARSAAYPSLISWDLKPCRIRWFQFPTVSLEHLEIQKTLCSIYNLYSRLMEETRKQGNNKKPTNRQTNKPTNRQTNIYALCWQSQVPGPTMLAPEVSETAARLPFVAFQTQADYTPRTLSTPRTTTSNGGGDIIVLYYDE